MFRLAISLFLFVNVAVAQQPAKEVQETVLESPQQVAFKVRMEGPYTADVPLQVVCYFRYTQEGAKKMAGAPIELDKHLGGVIASLRERGEFKGDELETILITPLKGSIPAKAILLIGLGDEAKLSLPLMQRVGTTALREAARLGVKKVAFAPLIRDQGNTKLSTGDVAYAVVSGMLLAYDTERRMQKESLAKEYKLEEWWMEAGPAYYEETVKQTKKAIGEADNIIKTRLTVPFIRPR
jgi:hypothetical protein